jgi:hypothetical protein
MKRLMFLVGAVLLASGCGIAGSSSKTCDLDTVFCKSPAEWTCPEEKEYFQFCRFDPQSRPDPEAARNQCAREAAYTKWMLSNCPGTIILE